VLGEQLLARICRVCYEAWETEAAAFIKHNQLSLKQPADRVRLLERFNAFMGLEAGASALDRGPEAGRSAEREREPICLPAYGPRPYWPF
jgi:hypothetical protein